MLNGKAKPSFDFFNKFSNSEISETINIEWLLNGRGEMLKKTNIAEPIPLDRDNESIKKIPLVGTEAIAGFGSANFTIGTDDIQSYYVVPDFKMIDFMIRISGSSMYPKYTSGDVVAVRVLHEKRFIQWNKTHLIATKEQGLLVKRPKPSELGSDWVKLISDNKEYDPFDVHWNDITGIALIVGVIRLES